VRRPTHAAAWATWLGLIAAAVGLVAVSLAFDPAFAGFTATLAAMAVLTGTVGLVIRLRRPDNRIGRLMAIGPLLMLTGFAGYGIGGARMLVAGDHDVLGGLAAAWGATAVLPGILLTFPVVVLLFPDGHLPGPRWRLALLPLLGLLGVGTVLTLVSPNPSPGQLPDNPLALPVLPVEAGGIATTLTTIALLGTVVLAIAAVAVRFRRSRGIERQQLKWLLGAVALAGVLFPVSFATDIGPADLIDIASIVAIALIPVSIGLAILRYRLYDIDRLVSRTVSWGAITVVLAAVFTAAVVGLQGALAGITGGSTLAVATSTLIAFALFQPIRRRVQDTVDRRFNRARYDGERLAGAFGEHVRNALDPVAASASLSETVRAAVAPTSVHVWLRPGR
jgi:hypothetical protein